MVIKVAQLPSLRLGDVIFDQANYKLNQYIWNMTWYWMSLSY